MKTLKLSSILVVVCFILQVYGTVPETVRDGDNIIPVLKEMKDSDEEPPRALFQGGLLGALFGGLNQDSSSSGVTVTNPNTNNCLRRVSRLRSQLDGLTGTSGTCPRRVNSIEDELNDLDERIYQCGQGSSSNLFGNSCNSQTQSLRKRISEYTSKYNSCEDNLDTMRSTVVSIRDQLETCRAGLNATGVISISSSSASITLNPGESESSSPGGGGGNVNDCENQLDAALDANDDLRATNARLTAVINNAIALCESRLSNITTFFFGGHYYYVYDGTALFTQIEAEAACRSFGMQLATVTSAAENTELATRLAAVNTALNNVANYYISLVDGTLTNVYTWSGTGAALGTGFTSWATGAPNDPSGLENCVAYAPPTAANNEWETFDCGTQSRFICEMESNCNTLLQL